MSVRIAEKDPTYLLNHCTKYLARDNTDQRHNFGQFFPSDPRARICESWRFPIVDSFSDGTDFVAGYAFNEVTFVYQAPSVPSSVGVIGTFSDLFEPVPMSQIGDTPFYSVTVVVPKGEVHTYKFRVNGELLLDPINPQRTVLDNGQPWSRFFCHLCTVPLSFERWEVALLDRLTDHILPFRTSDGENFLKRFYDSLDRGSRETQYVRAYRLDGSVGAVNYIDKLLAREENHHLIDYKICLELIDQVLRQRNPTQEPAYISREYYSELYGQMASNSVPGWNYGRYDSPRYFLQLLRRHTLTGAFSHPKYGGNSGAAGWAYLASRYLNEAGETLFDWQRAQEPPLGTSVAYRG